MVTRQEMIIRWLVWASLILSATFEIFTSARQTKEANEKPEVVGARAEQERSMRLSGVEPPPLPVGQVDFGIKSKISRIVYSIIAALCILSIAKNLCLCLLQLKRFEHFRWLDCFLLGRVSLDAHFAAAGKYFGIMFSFFLLGWLIMNMLIRPRFSFKALEFLLTPYDEVLAEEAASGPEEAGRRGRWSINKRHPFGTQLGNVHFPSPDRFWTYVQADEQVTLIEQRSLRPETHPSLQILLSSDSDKLRPNRTAQSWSQLASFTLTYFLSALLLILVLGPASFYVFTTNIITQRGFELYYSQCVDYIAGLRSNSTDLPAPSQQLYEQIYPANKSLRQLAFERQRPPLVLPMEDPIELAGWYHWLRVFADSLDNFLLWSYSASSFIIDTWIALIVIYDLRIYLDAVEQSLSSNLSGLGRLKWALAHDGDNSFPVLDSEHRKSQQRARVEDVQRLLMDFFKYLSSNNTFISTYTLYCIIVWLIFTATACICILNPKGSAVLAREEIFAIELFASFYFLVIVGFFAHFRSRMRRVYSMIASSMALDGNSRTTKPCWIVLLKHFHPAPLYCFSLFGSAEISWLFCLKVSL